ncbi:stage VI sporulation protein D [Pseudalkalibacillus hwajinpoensis]|uniref:Stage VI sporulation protein D n=1 Tax=Guptibacillus hwajinpoensis TaxID=208199 RepID=A0A4U1MIG9_9BACL|nr:stage VI sporulation protein D [Pseudalkalibacillus hwajinpoensis]TKD70314.1 stage VI sporulation protein D [Pseudalkalibacillus hwajinpoensis]
MPEGSYLHFSVEEQVWLKKGQEVEEVLSISLDPEISIEEYEDYVAVKGCLYLSGEYLQRDYNDDSDEPENEASAYRSIHEVHVREDGTASIGHRFPVDITIPASRVRSLEEIYVTVDTFDYTLNEANCLQLKADISISGIQGDEKRTEYEMYNEENDSADEDVEADGDETEDTVWETDVKYVDDSEEESSDLAYHLRSPQVDMRAKAERYLANLLDQENYEEGQEPTYDFLTKMARQIEDSNFYPPEQPAMEETNDYNVEEEEAVEKPQRSSREENALYLTSMLTKEEEQFSRMKMCIIQPGDSLTEIAERYRVLPSHLARVNRLEEDEVKEGQILYIPVNR